MANLPGTDNIPDIPVSDWLSNLDDDIGDFLSAAEGEEVRGGFTDMAVVIANVIHKQAAYVTDDLTDDNPKAAAQAAAVGALFQSTPYWKGTLSSGTDLNYHYENSIYRLAPETNGTSYTNTPTNPPKASIRYLLTLGASSVGVFQVIFGEHGVITTRRRVYRSGAWAWDNWEGATDATLADTLNPVRNSAVYNAVNAINSVIDVLKQVTSYPISTEFFDYEEKTSHGITYQHQTDGRWKVWGIADDTSAGILFFDDASTMPTGITKGRNYYIKYATNNDNVKAEFVLYKNNELTDRTYISFVEDGVLEVPSTTTGMNIRLKVPSGGSISSSTPAYVTFDIYSAQPSSDQLDNVIGIPLLKYTNTGYISMSGENQFDWAEIGVRGNYAIYDVAGGENIEIIAKSGASAVVAALRSYSTPDTGDTPDYSTDTKWDKPFYVTSSTIPFYGVIPSDATKLYVYCGTKGTERLPLSLKLNNYDILTNLKGNVERLANDADDVEPYKIRVMQYNIGKYDYGATTENAGLPDADYDEHIANYRSFFCRYAADIIGIEEWVDNIGKASGSHSTDTANDKIYDHLYANEAIQGQRAIKSRYATVKDSGSTITVYVDDDGTILPSGTDAQKRSAYYVKAHTVIGNKTIGLISIAGSYQHEDRTVVARQEQFRRAFALLNDYDYAFVICDQNTAGNDDDISSADDAENLLVVAHDCGFEGCNGAYLPLETTYHRQQSQGASYDNLKLDNIYYKDNGKIVFADFKVLDDEYDNLTSDHYPVIGDFILL